MAYIRYGTSLSSGKHSKSYVIGAPNALVCFNEGSEAIPYLELVSFFKTKSYNEIKQIIHERFLLSDEETDVVCDRLFDEHKNGEWNNNESEYKYYKCCQCNVMLEKPLGGCLVANPVGTKPVTCPFYDDEYHGEWHELNVVEFFKFVERGLNIKDAELTGSETSGELGNTN